jgi:hypothetical protein
LDRIVETVGLTSCVWGKYHRFVEGWWESVQQLDPAPDQVILVTDRFRDDIPCEQVVNPPYGTHQEAGWWTAGVNALTTTWRGTLGIDDKLRSDVYVGLPPSETADCWVLGFEERPVHRVFIPEDFTFREVLYVHQDNMFGHASLFTADVWERIGSQYPDVGWSDWSVFIQMARVKARFVNAQKIGFTSYRWYGSLSHTHANFVGQHRREAREWNCLNTTQTELGIPVV